MKGTGRDIADFQYGCHCDVNSNHGQLLHGKPVDQIDIGTDFFLKYLKSKQATKWESNLLKMLQIFIRLLCELKSGDGLSSVCLFRK